MTNGTNRRIAGHADLVRRAEDASYLTDSAVESVRLTYSLMYAQSQNRRPAEIIPVPENAKDWMYKRK